MVDDQRVGGWPGRDLRQRAESAHRRLDLHIGGRHDLRAVAEVELVAIVSRRVVARGDHYAGRGRQVPDREREQRGGTAAGQQVDADARPGEHGRDLIGELGRPVPCVPADHHAGLGRSGSALPQPASQGGGRGPDDGAVHPVRARADRAAQAGGAELQPAREPVGQLGPGDLAALIRSAAIGEKCPQLGPVRWIGVLGYPRFRAGPQIGGYHVTSRGARWPAARPSGRRRPGPPRPPRRGRGRAVPGRPRGC